MASRLRSLITGFSLAIVDYIDKPRDLGAGPWPMIPLDAAFWGFGPGVLKKICRGLIRYGRLLNFRNNII